MGVDNVWLPRSYARSGNLHRCGDGSDRCGDGPHKLGPRVAGVRSRDRDRLSHPGWIRRRWEVRQPMRRIGKRTTADQPLSKAAFIATRVLGLFMLAASVACVVVAWMYWERLSWPYRVLLDLFAALFFFGSREDVRQLFTSYDRYRQQWEENEGKKRQGSPSARFDPGAPTARHRDGDEPGGER